MTKFHPSQTCPKCGSMTRDIEFQRGARHGSREDRLLITCRTCTFVDYFEPMDAADPTEALNVSTLKSMWDGRA